jgi:uncharacterized protein YbgA (DUF1722 family)/uncharacterized protein YbbK (DUF523 family)
MASYAKPHVVVSRCLGFDACRYNGEMIPDRFLAALDSHARLTTVCPEVEIGLGTPRPTIRIEGEARRLVQPSTGLDLTERMVAYREERLDALDAPDGFVLKARSPSCGITDAKVHAPGGKGTLGHGPGLFAEGVLDRFPDVAVESEGRLTNLRIREHFLTRIFTTADFRRVRSRPSMGALVKFQARNKLLFMGLNQTRMRAMGRIVANAEKRPVGEVFDDYETELRTVLARMPRMVSQINVAMHALGYFKKELSAAEKAHFLDSLESYRAERVPLSAVTGILGSWVARFDEPYLAEQTWFAPFPPELVVPKDSGKGRGR